MSTYEEQRKARIARNRALFAQLELQNASHTLRGPKSTNGEPRPVKRRKIAQQPMRPQRSSARIAAVDSKPVYSEEQTVRDNGLRRRKQGSKKQSLQAPSTPESPSPEREPTDIDSLRKQWISWQASAETPSRDEEGTFHFSTHPDFTPNKSPAEVMREGSFGGSYWRPLYSRTLKATIADDYLELPEEWYAGLNVQQYMTNPTYEPEMNKYGVQAGQSIEAWEASGWINHDFDVRGWFQWYCRFFQGRRCEDDDRQISRWKKCVGDTGRWRRILLRKYVAAGIRSAVDDGGDEDEIEGVSPVIHQTCLHWAWEVRQGILDDWWESGGR